MDKFSCTKVKKSLPRLHMITKPALFFICYFSFVIFHMNHFHSNRFHMNRFHMNRFHSNHFDLALHIIGLLTIWIYVHLKHMVRFQITSLNTITFYSTFKIIY